MAASIQEIFGSSATYNTTTDELTIKLSDFSAAGFTDFANATAADGEKILAAILVFNANRTYTETHKVVVEKSFGGATLAQRNNTSHYRFSYNAGIYVPATGVPTAPDPDLVA